MRYLFFIPCHRLPTVPHSNNYVCCLSGHIRDLCKLENFHIYSITTNILNAADAQKCLDLQLMENLCETSKIIWITHVSFILTTFFVSKWTTWSWNHWNAMTSSTVTLSKWNAPPDQGRWWDWRMLLRRSVDVWLTCLYQMRQGVDHAMVIMRCTRMMKIGRIWYSSMNSSMGILDEDAELGRLHVYFC